MSFKLRLVA